MDDVDEILAPSPPKEEERVGRNENEATTTPKGRIITLKTYRSTATEALLILTDLVAVAAYISGVWGSTLLFQNADATENALGAVIIAVLSLLIIFLVALSAIYYSRPRELDLRDLTSSAITTTTTPSSSRTAK